MNSPELNTEYHVTAVITHLVKPGREEGYEEWIRGIIPVAKTFEGHLVVNILRPEKGLHPEYIIVLHFDHHKNLQAWLDSEVRREWIERAKPLIQAPEEIQILTGLETWFVLPRRSLKLPPSLCVVGVIACDSCVSPAHLRWRTPGSTTVARGGCQLRNILLNTSSSIAPAAIELLHLLASETSR